MIASFFRSIYRWWVLYPHVPFYRIFTMPQIPEVDLETLGAGLKAKKAIRTTALAAVQSAHDTVNQKEDELETAELLATVAQNAFNTADEDYDAEVDRVVAILTGSKENDDLQI